MEDNKVIVHDNILKQKQSAVLQDSLLNYMLDPDKNICLLMVIFRKCNPDNLPFEEFGLILKSLILDKMATAVDTGAAKLMYKITTKGKIFLKEGGYSKRFDEYLKSRFEEELDKEKNKVKRDLEIENLRAIKKHNKSTRIISIIAIIISGLTFIYLIVKDLL